MFPFARGVVVVAISCTLLGFCGAPSPARADDKADWQAATKNGQAAAARGDQAEAARQYERAVTLATAAFGADATETVASLERLARLDRQLGEYAKAEPLFQRSLKINEAKLGPDHLNVASSLNDLAGLYKDMGQYFKSETLYQRALKIREAKLGSDHLNVATSLNNLGLLYQHMGQHAKAEPLYLCALKINETKLAAGDPTIATNMLNLGALYHDMGQYAKAEPFYQRSIKINEAKFGPDHLSLTPTLSLLALLYQQAGQPDRAEPIYQRSLKINEARLGPDHPQVAIDLDRLAGLLAQKGRFDEAEAMYQRALKIREPKLGADHPFVAETLNHLANLYKTKGQIAQAETLYRRTLKIREISLGPEDRKVFRTLNDLATLHVGMSQFDAALEEFDRDRRLARRHAASILPMLAEKEQTQFLKRIDRDDLFRALSLGWTRKEDRPSAAASAAWLANGKGVAQDSLAQRAALGRDSQDPKLQTIAGKLLEVRTQLANLTNAQPKPGKEADRLTELAKWSEQEQDLSRQLNRAGGAAPPPRWVELDAVRRAIPKNALLVDILNFTPFDFAAKGTEKPWSPARYVAWVSPTAGDGDVRVIDLGEAEPIDAAVRRYQAAMAEAQTGGLMREAGEAGAAAALQKPLAELARLVLDPFKPAIGERTELILCPDAALWLIPWAALPTGKEDEFALEKWNMHYVTSARDLTVERRAASTNPPRVFANPNYDLSPSETPAVLAAIFGGPAVAPPTSTSSALSVANDRATRSAATIGRAASLPGTADEARAILPNLQKYAGQPKLYSGQQALEGVFKRLSAPRALVLSTHGFFLADQQVEHQSEGHSEPPLVDAAGQSVENPLLRCGLLLAGCNPRERITDKHLDDGVLTGMEIVGTNLRGTELVVLSACETGLGQVQNGEGVAGLRQAFQLAGAQAVVSTLWQIPDRETVQLMNDFFNHLAAGKRTSEALRDAQLAQIRQRRAQYGAAHPLYWAAFTLTGR